MNSTKWLALSSLLQPGVRGLCLVHRRSAVHLKGTPRQVEMIATDRLRGGNAGIYPVVQADDSSTGPKNCLNF